MTDTLLLVYCDGLCEPRNPGGYACWGWYLEHDGRIYYEDYGCLGHGDGMTNNLAEYQAVINALTWLLPYQDRIQAAGQSVLVRTDSMLVVRQVSREWACNKPHLQILCSDAQRLLQQIGGTIEWIPREQNDHADRLTRTAYAEARRSRAA